MTTVLLTLHFIGVGLAVGGAASGFMFRRALAKAEADLQAKAMPFLKTISMVGSVGFALLIVTGVAMMLGDKWWPHIMKIGAFHGKLGLVVIQIAAMGFTHANASKARKDPENLGARKRAGIGQTILTINGLLIVIVATYIFK